MLPADKLPPRGLVEREHFRDRTHNNRKPNVDHNTTAAIRTAATTATTITTAAELATYREQHARAVRILRLLSGTKG